MSTETECTGLDYPLGGARDLLRIKVSEVSIGSLSQEGRKAIFAAAEQLVEQTAALFCAYSYNAERTGDLRNRGYWTFALHGWEKALIVRTNCDNRQIFCFWLEIAGDRVPLELKPELVWDIAEARWYGPVLKSQGDDGYLLRDLSTPGFPVLRISPIEELVKAILRELQ